VIEQVCVCVKGKEQKTDEKKERLMLMLVEQVMCIVLYVRREKNKD